MKKQLWNSKTSSSCESGPPQVFEVDVGTLWHLWAVVCCSGFSARENIRAEVKFMQSTLWSKL